MSICYLEKTTINQSTGMLIPHMHLWFEFYVLVHGERSLTIENEEYSLSKNTLICIPPKHLHRFEGGNYTRYNINFTEDYLDDFQQNAIAICQQQKITMTEEEAKNVFQILDTLASIQNNKTNAFKNVKDQLFNTCFSYFIITLTRLKNFPTQKHTPSNNYSLLTRQIISHINQHYATKITLDTLAEKFHLSKRTLCSVFNRDTDMTIIDYLLNFRLDRASRLLSLANKRSLSQIAEQCGFSSPHYFSLIFKKKFNVSPLQYRNQMITLYAPPSVHAKNAELSTIQGG